MIKILHLYYDLLNLYGEDGNIKALCSLLDYLRIKYEVNRLSINDEVNISDYSFIYIGSGTESNQKLVLPHLLKYKESLDEYINKNKVILVTGNSIELFGKSIKDLDKEYESFKYI
jgi:lipid II isoglutaminyl synthase (glutamine-hydrolysing)